jgi:hypothetical protein
MSLVLDHINGVSTDNRIENLRMVCPNCAATLDTRCGTNPFPKKVAIAPTERLLSSLRWIPVDEPVSRRAGELGKEYRRSHPGLSVVDFVIAGNADLLEAELATGNVRRYPMFPSRAPPYPG